MEALGEQYVGDPSPSEWNLEGLSAALHAMGIDGPGTSEAELDEVAVTHEELVEHMRDARGRPAHGPRAGARRGGLEPGRAVRAPAHDRQPVGRAPDRGRRHAARHRAAWLRPAGPAQRVPQGGLPPVRGAQRPHPAPGRDHDLPGHREARARHRAARRARATGPPARIPAGDADRRRDRRQRHERLRRDPRRHAGRSARRARRRRRRAPTSGDRPRSSGLPADPMRGARETPGDAAASGSVRPGFTPSGARIGRNEPCWCGSGQKYKKCHGA